MYSTWMYILDDLQLEVENAMYVSALGSGKKFS